MGDMNIEEWTRLDSKTFKGHFQPMRWCCFWFTHGVWPLAELREVCFQHGGVS